MSFGQAGGAHLGRVDAAIERANGRKGLAMSTREQSANHSALNFNKYNPRAHGAAVFLRRSTLGCAPGHALLVQLNAMRVR
jgi:hypothetical protein